MSITSTDISFIPLEIWKNIELFLSDQDLARLSQTSRKMQGICKQELDIRKYYSRPNPEYKINFNLNFSPPKSIQDQIKHSEDPVLSKILECQNYYEQKWTKINQFSPKTLLKLRAKLRALWWIVHEKEQLKTQTKSYFQAKGEEYDASDQNETIPTFSEFHDKVNETCAKIGEFTLEGQKYQVVAFAAFSRFEGVFWMGKARDEENAKNFKLDGSVDIGIFSESEEGTKLNVNSLGPKGRYHSFIMQEEHLDAELQCCYYCENARRENKPVLSGSESAMLSIAVEYRDGFYGNKLKKGGRNRNLDEKLTQVMVEILRQNPEISTLGISSQYNAKRKKDDAQVPLAGGFFFWRIGDKMLKEIDDFREESKSYLYPPPNYRSTSYDKYIHNCMYLSQENIKTRKVQFATTTEDTWEKIIKKDPILFSDSGKMPPFWSTPFLFVLRE